MAYVHDNEDRRWYSPPKVLTPGGTGSASTLNMTDDEMKEAAKRKRQPVGFVPQKPKARKRGA